MTHDQATHGLRAVYLKGCRCLPCSAANATYEAGRARAHAQGRGNVTVDATRARAHLLALAKRGVGHHRAEALTERAGHRLSFTYLYSVRSGRRRRIRATTEAVILAVKAEPADGLKVNSYPTRHLLRCLTGEGFTLEALAGRLNVRLGWLKRHSPKHGQPPKHIEHARAERIRRFYQQITAE